MQSRFSKFLKTAFYFLKTLIIVAIIALSLYYFVTTFRSATQLIIISVGCLSLSYLVTSIFLLRKELRQSIIEVYQNQEILEKKLEEKIEEARQSIKKHNENGNAQVVDLINKLLKDKRKIKER